MRALKRRYIWTARLAMLACTQISVTLVRGLGLGRSGQTAGPTLSEVLRHLTIAHV